MAKKRLKPHEIVRCPKCGKHPEGEPMPASAFTEPGVTGKESRSSSACVYCDSEFTVEAVSDTEYVVKG